MSPRGASGVRDDPHSQSECTHLIHDLESAPFDAGCDRNHLFVPVSHDRTSSHLKIYMALNENHVRPQVINKNQPKLEFNKLTTEICRISWG